MTPQHHSVTHSTMAEPLVNNEETDSLPSSPIEWNKQPQLLDLSRFRTQELLLNAELLPLESLDCSVADPHGILIEDGWANVANPSCGSSHGAGAPMLPYTRGEKIYIEHDTKTVTEFPRVVVTRLDSDTTTRLELSYPEICLIPKMFRFDRNGKRHLALPADRTYSGVYNGTHLHMRPCLEWPDDQPQQLSRKLECWPAGDDRSTDQKSDIFRRLDSREQENLFQYQWGNRNLGCDENSNI